MRVVCASGSGSCLAKSGVAQELAPVWVGKHDSGHHHRSALADKDLHGFRAALFQGGPDQPDVPVGAA